MRIRQATIPIGLASILMLAACANELDGPEPRMSGDADSAISEPSFACNEQLESWIVLRGDGFSPLVVDTIDGEKDFSIELPKLRLIQRSDVDGGASSGFSITLESLDGVEDGDIKWVNDKEMHFRVRPDHELPPGVYDVDVENASGARSLQESAFGILPRPTVNNVRPDLLCLAQGERGLIIDGADFLIHGQAHRPTVVIDAESYEVTEAEGCRALPEIFDGHELCDTLHIVVGADQHAPGSHAVTVENIAPAACTSTDVVELHVVPAPTLASIADNPICTERFDNAITLQGTGFLRIGAALPEVHIGAEAFPVATLEGCSPVAGPDDVETCTTATLSISTGALAEAGVHEVSLRNPQPAGCHSEDPVTLTVASPPTVAAVTPQPICTAEADQTLTVSGTDFLIIDGALPTIHVGERDYEAAAADGCEAVTIYNQTATVERCTSLEFIVAQDDFEAGTQSVTVTNPETAACSSVEEVEVRFVAPPSLDSIVEEFACVTDGPRSFILTGEGFLVVDGVLPNVHVGELDIPATATDGCEAIDIPGGEASLCTSLTFEIGQDEALTGVHDVFVTNPEPAACLSSNGLSLFITGPPVLVSADPAAFCDGAGFDGDLTLTGESFIFTTTGAGSPTVMINGEEIAIASASECETISLETQTIESCARLHLTGLQSLQGDLDISVTNPDPAACGQATITVVEAISPRIDSVSPQRICIRGTTVDLTGEFFEDGMVVFIGGQASDSVQVLNNGTAATATFSAGGLDTGQQFVSARNPAGCEDTFAAAVEAVDGPTAFYVDPPTVYDGVTTQITIYFSGLQGTAVTDVRIADSQGTETVLPYTVDAARPNTIQATIPAGALPENVSFDDYAVIINDDFGCPGVTEGLLTITEELTIAIEKITPPFGWTESATGVLIQAINPAPQGQVQFAATPRVYINPSDPQGTVVARELRSIQFINETELAGVIPANLAIGDYDIIIVNPDGAVGVLERGFEVTVEPPPVVETVSPGSWRNDNATLAVAVEGTDFRNVSVSVDCQDGQGTPTASPSTITIDDEGANFVDITVNTNNLAPGSVCVLRITNDDETYAEYAPITVTNPAGNFIAFHPGATMNEARRAPTGLTGRPASRSRYVYSVGGDDGVAANAKTTGEAAVIDRFGMPTQWFPLPYELPQARTLAQGARIGDFVYILGGHDGTSATTEVYRAHVLNPLDVPTITNLEIDLDLNATGLDLGVYYYRVAEVLAQIDPANPGGETLSSDPQPVRVPVAGISVTIGWAPPQPGANVVGYRVYRSASPDLPYGNEELIAEVDANTHSFTDDGTTPTQANEHPLRLGSLGQWHEVANLTTARHSHAVVSAVDPAASNVRHIYAIGGRDDAAALASYEYLTVTIIGPKQQAVSVEATPGATALSVARYELAAVNANPQNASRLGKAFIFALGGQTDVTGAGANASRLVNETAEVLPGGALSPFTLMREMAIYRAGYTAAVANNQTVVFGGHNAAPNASGHKTEILCNNCTTPALDQWNSLSNISMEPRYLMGFTSIDGFIYMTGGLTSGNVASATSDYCILGGTP